MDVDPQDLAAHINATSRTTPEPTGEGGPVILDVRSSPEYAAGHIPGALHLPFWSALFRAGRIPARRDDPVVIYCAHGARAEMAAAALRVRGFRHVRLLRGHMSAWRRSGRPTER